MAKPEKAAAVAELTERFRSSTASVLTEYRGLTVAQLKELRRSLGGNAQYAVVKNTLTAIAAKEAGVDAFDGQLTGPSAIAFVTGDPVEAAKGLRDFARTHPQLVIKSGYLEGRALDAAEITRLADLESREVLLAKLAGAMKASLNQAAYLFVAPLSQAARVVDALRAKVEEGAPASSAATAGSGGVHDGSAEAGSAEAGSADAGSAEAGSAEAGSADAASGAAEAPSEPASEATAPS